MAFKDKANPGSTETTIKVSLIQSLMSETSLELLSLNIWMSSWSSSIFLT